MSNEGEYLEMVNELRDQYNDMKERYEMEKALMKEELNQLKDELEKGSKLKFIENSFDSTRPIARRPIYVNY